MVLKLKIHIPILALLLLWTSNTSVVNAQGSSILGKFTLSQANGQVSLFWQIIAGNTCNGIQIYRSTDSIQYSRIGYIGGICGSETEAVNYTFTDSIPVNNTVNYYYLELGGVGTSNTLSIDVIDAGESGYQIRPHPVLNSARIYFDALSSGSYTIRIYDFQGQLVFSTESLEDRFDIDTAPWPSGPYAFTISDADNSVLTDGVMIVQH